MNERVKELEILIARYQASYYNDQAEISDARFDALWDELRMLEPEHKLLHQVGADGTEQFSGVFAKAAHIIPMGSQEKAANPAEFATWALKQVSSDFLVEYKLDGASIELQYENGVFTRAVTRGDGLIGDDITRNALKMNGLVRRLPSDTLFPLSGGVRGEVIMTHEVREQFFSDKANCRNAANGLMKRKDGQGCEHLRIICYDAYFSENAPFTNETQKLEWLTASGFNTVPLTLCTGAEEVIQFRQKITELRPTLSYDIDGLVVKTDTIDLDDARRDRPEKQIAFKFELQEAVSIVRSVIWSESGATYTPIAEFDPVELAGTTVQRASLNNPNMFRALGVRLGSHIIVTKRGEIIPKVESVVHNPPDAAEVPVPTVCSSCNTTLTDDGTRLYCPNSACPKRIHHRLEKWISVLDVRDFGIQLIKRLFDSGRVRSVSDFYTLTVEELAVLDRMGEKSAQKVIASLESKRFISLAAFIAGFDIEGIGETLVEKVVTAGFNTLESLLKASSQEFAAVYGFGEITARILADALAECAEEMRCLVNKGFITLIAPPEGATLAGKSFCFTGELLSIKRAQAEQRVKMAGGSVKSSITKDLTYLVTNDTTSGSSKNKKAGQLGIPIISEEQFLLLLDEGHYSGGTN